jgi:hypothetical protein
VGPDRPIMGNNESEAISMYFDPVKTPMRCELVVAILIAYTHNIIRFSCEPPSASEGTGVCDLCVGINKPDHLLKDPVTKCNLGCATYFVYRSRWPRTRKWECEIPPAPEAVLSALGV